MLGSFPPPAKRPTTDPPTTLTSPAIPSLDVHSDAPPPYTSPQVWGSTSTPSDTKKPLPQQPSQPFDASSSSSSAIPQTLRQGSRTLHIYRLELFSRDLTIMDADKTTIAYSVAANMGTIFSDKPHMRVYRGPVQAQSSTTPAGTATFHRYSRTIDLELHGRPTPMDSKGIFSFSHEFMSGIGPLSWKSNGWGSDLILMTAENEWLAKFEGNRMAVEKRGTLEIVSWDIGDDGLDEIVASGVAMVEYLRRRRR